MRWIIGSRISPRSAARPEPCRIPSSPPTATASPMRFMPTCGRCSAPTCRSRIGSDSIRSKRYSRRTDTESVARMERSVIRGPGLRAASRRSIRATNRSYSRSLAQPRQHLQPCIAIGGLEPGLALECLHRDHRVAADPAVGAAGIEAERGQAPLNLLQFLERRGALAAGKFQEIQRRLTALGFDTGGTGVM